MFVAVLRAALSNSSRKVAFIASTATLQSFCVLGSGGDTLMATSNKAETFVTGEEKLLEILARVQTEDSLHLLSYRICAWDIL